VTRDADPTLPTGGDLAPTIVIGPEDRPAAGTPRPTTFGHYRIVKVLGEGGMGTVYEAEQDQPRRRVALKVIKPGLAGPELLRRFALEADALGRLQHPGIAQIYEAGTAQTPFGTQPYFAMEFIEGQTLLEHIKTHHLSTRQCLKIIALTCEAVHHAHQRGIIHRDLKPRNILVTERGQPKVLDFGVARVTDSDAQATRQTDVGQLIGTLAYMSPEQVLADPLEIDTRSDVYALGVIMYEALSGHLPYNVNRKAVHEAVQTIRDEEPTRLSSVSRVYRGDIETIVAKALEKDKARRYAAAADLAQDIWRYLDDEPIVARPASVAYQLRKLAHRHKALVAGVAAVFIVLLAGIVASTWQAARAMRAEQEAVVERDRAVEAEARTSVERDRATAAERSATAERDRAVTERQRADTEAATAKAINEFLQGDLLAQASVAAQARPDTKSDPDLKVRTALDRAAVRIEHKFDSQPLVEASIRQTIGDTYKALGLYPEAQRQLERAHALQKRVLPAEHPDRLHTMNNLAEVYWNQGKYDEAKPLFTAALAGRLRVLGDTHRDTLTTENNLAALYWSQGQYAQAEPLFTKTLDAMRRALGPEHPDTLGTMNNLALLYRTQGKFVQAESLYTTALETRRRVLGAEHPDTLSTMNNLAALYSIQGKTEEAEALLTKALDGMRRVLSEEHPDTLRSMSNLATLYQNQRKLAQAEQLYTKVLETQRRVLGDQHPDTLIAMSNLALNYLSQRKYDQAEPLLVSSYEGMRQRAAAAPRGIQPALEEAGKRLVQLYQTWGKPDKAAEWTQKLRRPQ
jgi:tetratricopeptide (TPR) repeat protein/predicted Ser/Thr protein kinase